jgi:hypothetical protein
MERLWQRVLMPLEDVGMGANDCLYFRDLVVREMVANLDRIDFERSSIWGGVRVL